MCSLGTEAEPLPPSTRTGVTHVPLSFHLRDRGDRNGPAHSQGGWARARPGSRCKGSPSCRVSLFSDGELGDFNPSPRPGWRAFPPHRAERTGRQEGTPLSPFPGDKTANWKAGLASCRPTPRPAVGAGERGAQERPRGRWRGTWGSEPTGPGQPREPLAGLPAPPASCSKEWAGDAEAEGGSCHATSGLGAEAQDTGHGLFQVRRRAEGGTALSAP